MSTTTNIEVKCVGCVHPFNEGEARYVCTECKGLQLCPPCWRKDVEFHSNPPLDRSCLIQNCPFIYKHTDSAQVPHQFTLETKSQSTLLATNKGATTYDTFRTVFEVYRDRPCLGTRKQVTKSTAHPFGLGEYQWQTYFDLRQKSEWLGNALARLLPTRSFVGICSNNCLEWYYADFACLWFGMRVIPYHHQLNVNSMSELLNNSETSCMVISKTAMPTLVQILESGRYTKLKVIVHIENDYDRKLRLRLPSNIQFRLFSKMLDCGRRSRPLPHNPLKSDDIMALTYSSGSTGLPKGVISRDRENNNFVAESKNDYPYVVLSYSTMAHAQRRFDHKNLYSGGRIGLFSGNMETLFDDLRELRPHSFWGVPRVFNIIFSQYQRELEDYRLEHPQLELEQCQTAMVHKFKTVLGDRVSQIVTGSAPLRDDTMAFMKQCWTGVPILVTYGSTESLIVSVNGNVLPNVEYRIETCKELGYSVDDQPNPRGQLMVRSPSISSGYYRNDEAGKKAFVDGWYVTGDIIEELAPRKIKIIDRMKNAFKLSNGEFVVPEPLENMFYASPMIENIFIYGDTNVSFLVAVVVPKRVVLEKYGSNMSSSMIKRLIMREIDRISKENKLSNYETPKIISISEKAWTVENGMINGTGKYVRNEIFNHYKNDILEMYEVIDSIQDGLRNNSGSKSCEQVLETYLKMVLGLDLDQLGDDDLEGISFTQIGGDSIGAVKLSNLLKESNPEITPQFILNKNISLKQIFNRLRPNQTNDVKPAKIDWKREMTLDASITTKGKTIKPMKQSGNNILLTGCTGFLGSFLLYDLLVSTGSMCGNIYCLVRGHKTLESAKLHIVRLLQSKHIHLRDQQIEKINPVLGDLELDNFGLNLGQMKYLANNIDIILHNGAIVNLISPYENLRQSNVHGTTEVLRLACLGPQIIRVAHVSTIGCFARLNRYITDLDQPNINDIDTMYGYQQSKLVGEQLIQEAHARGIPTMMFRPSSIYAHSVSGVDNEHDLIRLIIRGFIYMGAYPSLATNNKLNLTPVDWVSSSIAHLTLANQLWSDVAKDRTSTPIYHLANQHSISVQELCSSINVNNQGQQILKEISMEEWTNKLVSQANNPLNPFSRVFQSGQYPVFIRYGFCIPFTLTDLANINKGPCPLVTSKMINTNIHFINKGK
ncbi:hypothetical protein SAMD00019534_018720 [Acytostelium subglobosum LB1]|uniref:hypothetical protein n=1 Tax=Acytostelium subglobosum LB1 TaxID=1410327 RepID=UPI000644FCAB|nr:hypothetical protein SAMD00019534_018720 [Acytostelium subglobosum LB1]GAM18697.1 hypothetical protein SAMD00019534_018720 [Acytostelium subglobosum LB1]|eukprot:XP_012757917.1 hypothetical protein SAMD00019534_018720 [Acytostelium subglobosum LB1]